MTGVIAVHLGAGHHNRKLYPKYRNLSRAACKAGIEVLRRGGSALEAVKAALVVLEDDPLTNAGYGSNLTTLGIVECDASVMDGKTLTYGGCGAIQKVKNPIELAYDLCIKQSDSLPLNLVPPSLLVGNGGLYRAKQIGLKTVPNKALISPKALHQFKKYKTILDIQLKLDNNLLDTVGAVCIDDSGHVASACSSGGLLMKTPGRVGQAALYASGVWADSFNRETEPCIAVCTTGCGEHLVQTQLAKEITNDLKSATCPTTGLYNSMNEKFLKSKYLRNIKQKLGGALVVHVSKSGDGSVLWGHSTESMSVAYMEVTDKKAKSLISELPDNVAAGTTINVGGANFYVSDGLIK